MDRVKKMLDNAAGNMLRVTFERGPNGQFSFAGVSEPSKLEQDLPAVDGRRSEMKESSSKESADSGYTEGASSPLKQPIKKLDVNEVAEPKEAKGEKQQKKKNKKRRKKNKVAPVIKISDDSTVEKTEISVLSLGRSATGRYNGAIPSNLVAGTLPKIPEETPRTVFPRISDVKRSLVQSDTVCTKTKPDLDALFGKQTSHGEISSRPGSGKNTELPSEADKYSKIPRNRLKLPSLFAKKKKTGVVTIPKELVGEDDEATLMQPCFAPCPPKKGNVLPAKESVPFPPQPPASKTNMMPCPPKKRNTLSQMVRPLPFIRPKSRNALPQIGTTPAPKVQQATAATRPTTKVEPKPAKAAGVPSWWNDPIPTERPKASCGRSDQPSDYYRQRSTASHQTSHQTSHHSSSHHSKQQERPVRKTARDFHTFTWDAYLPRFRAMDKPSRRLEPPPEKAFQRRMRPFGLRTRRANESDTQVEDLDL